MRAPGRVDAGDQQQAQRALQVRARQRLAFHFRVEQKADQIVAAMRPALLDFGPEISGHFLQRRHDHRFIADADLEHQVDPAAEQVAVLLGHPEHVGDQPHRDVLRVVDRGIAGFGIADRIQQLAAQRTCAGLQARNRLRRKRGQEEFPRRRVLGRVRGDRRRRGERHLVFADDDPARGKMLRIVGNLAHLGVTRRKVGAVLKTVRVRDRAAAAQFVPDREGILDPRRIAMIEVGRPVLDRRVTGFAISIHG